MLVNLMDVASSSSSSSSSSRTYDVFLNFRGEDTRQGFVCHLHKALELKALKVYIDKQGLKKGDHLLDLLKAIAESKISIVVFSENYATSTWCLRELVQILECKENQKQIVMPVFYKVDPSHIRKQKGRFGEAFDKLIRDRKKDKELLQEVQTWRSALNRATDLSGWDSKNYEDDATLIDDIVRGVFREVTHMSSSSKESDLVGIDSRIQKMRLGLPLQMDKARKVGIWGMGGIGKTTIATGVYDRIRSEFDHCCLLKNVPKDGESMLKNILSSFLGEKPMHTLNDAYNRMEGPSNRKVLVVLDDVDKLDQIDPLIRGPSFGDGSIIIVTTRHCEILRGFERHQVELLNETEALKLFSQNAFKTNPPSKEYDDLSRRAVQHAKGLPLALRVLGSLLDDKSTSEWEEELDKIKERPNSEIRDVLKRSFDGLDDDQKKIFLDIACFFRGMARDCVIKVLDSCGFYPYNGLQVLVRRALVTISKSDELEMHDLLLEMGRQIAKEDGKRSRFWGEDAECLLTENTATENVEGLMIDLPNKEHKFFRSEAFVRMKNLRLLIFTYGQRYYGDDGENHLDEELKFLSSKLRVLVWHGYPLKCLPSNFDPKNLVHLDMGHSKIEQLWEASKPAKKLIKINLSGSPNLKSTPDLTRATNLEELRLAGCSSLTDVHPSILTLPNLVSLSLGGCHELRRLPSSIHMKSLKTLNLDHCLNLEMFPEISVDMEALSELHLTQTAIEELPSSIERLRGLKSLDMPFCYSLIRLPDSICNLAELRSLSLRDSSKLCKLPENIGNLESLLKLEVNGSGLEQLPVSILRLKLGELSFSYCKKMAAPLSSWPSSIEDRCTVVVHLDFSGCNLLELSDSIAYFSSLKVLRLSGNENLESLPAIMKRLDCLEELVLNGCKRLRSIPELSPTIRYINAHDCTALESVSTPVSPYGISRCFIFSNCSQLVQKDVFRDTVETHLPPQGNCSRPFYVSFPGRKIPKWFTHRCRGSSVTAKLPPNWFDKKFLGFTICAVTNKPRDDERIVRCICTFKGDHCKYRFSFYLSAYCRESNHMLVGYMPWSESGMIKREEVNERRYTEAKFEIQWHYEAGFELYKYESSDPFIKRCGVRFVFADKEEDFGEPMVEVDNFERRLEGCSVEPSGSGITSDTSDEDEQYLKLLSKVFKGANRRPSYIKIEDSDSSEGSDITGDTSYEDEQYPNRAASSIKIEDNDSSGKRKTLESWTQEVRVTSGLSQGRLDDGFIWFCCEFGIHGSKYICTHRGRVCWAKAIVPAHTDPTILKITYVGRHTCWKFQPMLTHQVRVTPGMKIEGPFDGFTWRKYDQKDMPGAKYPRVYYVCTPQNIGGCMAVKEVQSSNDKQIIKITYRGRHTCTLASTNNGGRGDSKTFVGSGASSIHDQVIQSPSSPGANGHGGNIASVAGLATAPAVATETYVSEKKEKKKRKQEEITDSPVPVPAKKSKGEEVAELEVEKTEKKKRKKKDKDNGVLDSSDGETSVKVKKHRDKEEAGSPQTEKSEKKKKKKNKEAEDHGADAATGNGKGDRDADKSEKKKKKKKDKSEEVAELEVEKTEKKKNKDNGVLDSSDGEKYVKVKNHKDKEEAGSPQTEKSEKKKNKEAEDHCSDAATDNGKGDGEAEKTEKKKKKKKKKKNKDNGVLDSSDGEKYVKVKKHKDKEEAGSPQTEKSEKKKNKETEDHCSDAATDNGKGDGEAEKTEKKKKKKKNKNKDNGVLDSSDGEKYVKVKKHKDKEEAGSPQTEKSEKKKNKEAEDHCSDAATDNGKGDGEADKSEKKKKKKKKDKSEEVAELEVEKTENKKRKKKDKENGVLDSSDGEKSVKVKKHKDKEEAGSPQTEKKKKKEAEDHGSDAATDNGKGDGEADKSEKKKKKKKKDKSEEVAELEVGKTEKKKRKKKDKENGGLDSSDGEKSVKVKKHKDKEDGGSPQTEKSEKKKNKEAEDHGADFATDNGNGDGEADKSEREKKKKKKRINRMLTKNR